MIVLDSSFLVAYHNRDDVHHEAAAFEVFRGQPAGYLSFTDAAIVALAREHGCPHVATFDADFGDVKDLTPVPG